MLGHALCHALSFHSQTITHSITNNQSYYQNNQSCWKTVNPTTDLLLWGKIYCSNTTLMYIFYIFPGFKANERFVHVRSYSSFDISYISTIKTDSENLYDLNFYTFRTSKDRILEIQREIYFR